MVIKLELKLDEVNYILSALALRPYGEVFELVNKVKKQSELQIEPK